MTLAIDNLRMNLNFITLKLFFPTYFTYSGTDNSIIFYLFYFRTSSIIANNKCQELIYLNRFAFYAIVYDNLQLNLYYIELMTFFQTYFTYEGYGRHPEHAIHPNCKYLVTIQSLPMYIGENNQVNSVITADVTSPGWLLSH